jgi:hypothetical protein
MTQPPYWTPAAPPPKRRNPMPWLIALLALSLAFAAVVGVLLLTDDDASPAPAADRSADQNAPADASVPPAGDGGSVDGSADRAAAFMDDVVRGDYAAAVGHGSADFAERFGPEGELLSDHVTTLIGGEPTEYLVDAVDSDEASGGDVVTLGVTLTDGGLAELRLLVVEDDGSAVVAGFE